VVHLAGVAEEAAEEDADRIRKQNAPTNPD
jgi:hypothetical protein